MNKIEKSILVFCAVLILFGFVGTVLPVETFSGEVTGISGHYRNDRAYFNTLYITNEGCTKKAGTLHAGWESWDEAKGFYEGKITKIHRNLFGRWYVASSRKK